jgi:hypothetical protein
VAACVLLGLLGCGGDGPVTHAVSGKVEVSGGDVKDLAGGYVEAALTTDPTLRASGEIQEDGSFILETLHNGVTLRGAREGTYQVRLILPDNDKGRLRRAQELVAPRFLQFKTSGLTLTVPPPDEVSLLVSKR